MGPQSFCFKGHSEGRFGPMIRCLVVSGCFGLYRKVLDKILRANVTSLSVACAQVGGSFDICAVRSRVSLARSPVVLQFPRRRDRLALEEVKLCQ